MDTGTAAVSTKRILTDMKPFLKLVKDAVLAQASYGRDEQGQRLAESLTASG